jgi:hypothetical protein
MPVPLYKPRIHNHYVDSFPANDYDRPVWVCAATDGIKRITWSI